MDYFFLAWCHDVEVRLLQDFLGHGCTLRPFTGWKMVWMWDDGASWLEIPWGCCCL